MFVLLVAVKAVDWIDNGPNIQKMKTGWEDGGFGLSAYKISVTGEPYDPAKHESDQGVGHWYFKYSYRHRFFPVRNADGEEGVVWQTADAKACTITWHKDMASVRNVELDCKGSTLVAATHNSKDSIVFMTVDFTGEASNKGKINSIRLAKVKMSDGSLVTDRVLPLGEDDFNAIGTIGSMASLEWNVGKNLIGLILASQMHGGHHSARSAAFDSNSLKTTQAVAQTSSHSWAHSLTLLSDGRFWILDACDNFDRGLAITEIGTRKKRLPYRFKQKAGDNNDNNVYTEPAHRALVESGNRVVVVFSGEGLGHKSFDTASAKSDHNEAYNLAVISIDKDLDSAQVYSEGPEEKGTFTNFNGKQTPMEHKGVTWLTKYTDMQHNVNRVKTFATKDKIVIMYELWKPKTFGGKVIILAIDNTGKIVLPEVEIPPEYGVRLTLVDDWVSFDGDRAILYRGENGKLVRYEFALGSPPPLNGDGGSQGNESQGSGGAVFVYVAVALGLVAVAAGAYFAFRHWKRQGEGEDSAKHPKKKQGAETEKLNSPRQKVHQGGSPISATKSPAQRRRTLCSGREETSEETSKKRRSQKKGQSEKTTNRTGSATKRSRSQKKGICENETAAPYSPRGERVKEKAKKPVSGKGPSL